MHNFWRILLSTAFVLTLAADGFKISRLAQLSAGLVLTLGIKAGAVSSTVCPSSMCPSKASFYVKRATESQIRSLKVDNWNTWSSSDSPSYAVHKLKNKVYATNELCYIDKGKFTVTPKAGKPVEVKSGDFILFPKDFSCTWDVEEPVFKHWYEY